MATQNFVKTRSTHAEQQLLMYIHTLNIISRRSAFIKPYDDDNGDGVSSDVLREHVINFKAGKTARMHRRVQGPTASRWLTLTTTRKRDTRTRACTNRRADNAVVVMMVVVMVVAATAECQGVCFLA